MKNIREDRPYWNMDIEPLLNTPEMKRLQLDKLRKRLILVKEKAPFFARMMERKHFNPENLRSFEEFQEKFDIFTKETFRRIVEECGDDYLSGLDQIMTVRVHELDWMATTTGTTGVPTPYPLTNNDVQNLWGEVEARCAWRAGVRSDDRMLYCFALSMVIAGVPSMIGFQRTGALILPVGAEAKSERILLTQKLFRGTVYVGTPSLAEYLIEQAPKVLDQEVGEFGFKALLCGGEPGAGIPAVRAKLEKAYGCRIYDMGAGFGCSCDHDEYQGMHCVADDLAYYELVDPVTKRPVPLENGAQGEALWTTLEGDGWLWIRQGLGDIHQVFTEPCPCGRTGFRYRVIGRSDDMLKVKGVMVYPSHLKGLINEFVPRVTGEMRIVLREKPPRVVPPLSMRVEHGEGLVGSELKALEDEIVEAMSKRLKISPQILWEEPGSLQRSHYKGQMFEKLYDEA